MEKKVLEQFKKGKMSLYEVYEMCNSDKEFYEFLAEVAQDTKKGSGQS